MIQENPELFELSMSVVRIVSYIFFFFSVISFQANVVLLKYVALAIAIVII